MASRATITSPVVLAPAASAALAAASHAVASAKRAARDGAPPTASARIARWDASSCALPSATKAKSGPVDISDQPGQSPSCIRPAASAPWPTGCSSAYSGQIRTSNSSPGASATDADTLQPRAVTIAPACTPPRRRSEAASRASAAAADCSDARSTLRESHAILLTPSSPSSVTPLSSTFCTFTTREPCALASTRRTRSSLRSRALVAGTLSKASSSTRDGSRVTQRKFSAKDPSKQTRTPKRSTCNGSHFLNPLRPRCEYSFHTPNHSMLLSSPSFMAHSGTGLGRRTISLGTHDVSPSS